MLDTRLKTYITLIEAKSTVVTAEILHITQPAVSQHIHSLEKEYGAKLFDKEGRSLVPTPKGMIFYENALRIAAMERQLTVTMKEDREIPVKFGVTRSIGEGVMPSLMPPLLEALPGRQMIMRLQNTRTLLEDLENGEIDFALLEGNVSHRKYECRPLKEARFIGVCKRNGRYSDYKTLLDTCNATLLLREEGSGSREILISELKAHDIEIKDFKEHHVFESIPVILSLVEKDMGITFIYEEAARELIQNRKLQQLIPENFSIQRQFTFVSLPNFPKTKDNLGVYSIMKKILQKHTK